MRTSRLEAFTDGVVAIIITIMVLELKVPESDDLAALTPAVGSSLLTYLLSLLYSGIFFGTASNDRGIAASCAFQVGSANGPPHRGRTSLPCVSPRPAPLQKTLHRTDRSTTRK